VAYTDFHCLYASARLHEVASTPPRRSADERERYVHERARTGVGAREGEREREREREGARQSESERPRERERESDFHCLYASARLHEVPLHA